MDFEVITSITEIEVIADGSAIREIERLREAYGPGRWRKLKGNATVLLDDGTTVSAELHWYEAHGIDRQEMKIKRFLDDK